MRSTPAREMITLPWMTIPELRTWSTISTNEMSLSSGTRPLSRALNGSGMVARHERIRRPGAGGLDRALLSPMLRILPQDIVPLLGFGSRQEESRLPLQPFLSGADLAGLRRVARDFLQFTGNRARRFILAGAAAAERDSFLAQIARTGTRRLKDGGGR